MKKIRILIAVILIAATLLSAGVTASAAGVQAVPISSTVLVNGASVAFEGYTIGGNNYFKLRDLAMAFVGKTKRFSVEWDNNANAIRLMSGQQYTPVGGELTVSGSKSAVLAQPASAQVYYDSKIVSAKAYSIGGYNYFRLRDLGAAMTFSVTYDNATKAIKIDTTKEYYLPALLELLPGATYKEYYTPEQLMELPSGTTAEGFIFYNRTDSGSIAITEYSRTIFSIVGVNLTSNNDLAKLKNIVGIFVSSPDQVLEAAKSSKTDSQKTLQIEGKAFICAYTGESLTIKISW